MDLSDLKVFEAVSRLGSMRRAASELHTVPSNVASRIRVLEEEWGICLFQRHARGVTPTPAGRRVLPYVARLTKLAVDARSARDDGTPNGDLVVGSLETTAALRLAPLLVRFTKAYPEVRVAITTGTTARLLNDVIECRLDGAFVAGPVDHPHLDQQAFFREELVLITAPSIRTLRELTAIESLKTSVFQPGCSYRQRLEATLAEMGIAITEPQEFGSLDAIISCVSAGLGVTLMPRGVVASSVQGGRLAAHKLPPSRAMVETVFVRRKDAYVSSAMTALFDLIRSQTD